MKSQPIRESGAIIVQTLQAYETLKNLADKMKRFHIKALEVQFKFKSQIMFNKARLDYLKSIIKTEMEDYKADLAKKKD